MAWSEWKKFSGGLEDIPFELGMFVCGYTSSTSMVLYEQYLPCSGYKYAKLKQSNIKVNVYPISIVDGVKTQGSSLGKVSNTETVIKIPDGTVALHILHISGGNSQNLNITHYGLYTSEPQ